MPLPNTFGAASARGFGGFNFQTPRDPNFSSVSLLLPGNGTNGAQNNTFLDSSTNNFTITRNGNTTQGTFSPFSQTGWGNYFQGSGNYLTLADGTQFNLSGAAYTIECWIYPNGDYGNYNTIVAKRAPSSSSTAWEVYLRTGSGVLSFYNGTNYESAITPPAFQWNHVAAVFDGTNINLYLNGVRVLQSPTTNSNISASVFIGTYPSYDERYIGYISDLRITKGAALYTGASFTVPTTALTTTVSSGTVSLLTCQNNRFIDNSVNAAAITITGSPSTQPFTPFNPTAAWSAATNGGSGYFDGSGDYLNFTDSSNALDLGGAAASIELFFYPTAGGTQVILGKHGGSSNWSTSSGFEYQIQYTSNIFYFYYNSGGSPVSVTDSVSRPANQWYHIAVATDASNNISFYINGTRVATSTSAITKPTTRTSFWLASDLNSNTTFGYVSNLRFISGANAYTASSSTLTVPTSPPTAVTGTQLLLSFTNAGIYDAAAKNDLETVGNAQISTAQSKWGGSSMYFDGSGDYLRSPYSPNFQMNTGDFTVEFWVYLVVANNYGLIFNIRNSTAQYSPLQVYIRGTRAVEFYSSTNGSTNSSLTSSMLVPLSTWTHVAVVRYSGTVKIYINGIADANTLSLTGSLYLDTTWGNNIGGESGGNDLNAYLQDLRITKGIARYTSNFTPPTTAFLTL